MDGTLSQCSPSQQHACPKGANIEYMAKDNELNEHNKKMQIWPQNKKKCQDFLVIAAFTKYNSQ